MNVQGVRIKDTETHVLHMEPMVGSSYQNVVVLTGMQDGRQNNDSHSFNNNAFCLCWLHRSQSGKHHMNIASTKLGVTIKDARIIS